MITECRLARWVEQSSHIQRLLYRSHYRWPWFASTSGPFLHVISFPLCLHISWHKKPQNMLKIMFTAVEFDFLSLCERPTVPVNILHPTNMVNHLKSFGPAVFSTGFLWPLILYTFWHKDAETGGEIYAGMCDRSCSFLGATSTSFNVKINPVTHILWLKLKPLSHSPELYNHHRGAMGRKSFFGFWDGSGGGNSTKSTVFDVLMTGYVCKPKLLVAPANSKKKEQRKRTEKVCKTWRQDDIHNKDSKWYDSVTDIA